MDFNVMLRTGIPITGSATVTPVHQNRTEYTHTRPKRVRLSIVPVAFRLFTDIIIFIV